MSQSIYRPYDPKRSLGACSCGAHGSEAEHNAAGIKAQQARASNPETLSQDFVEAAVVKALFTQDRTVLAGWVHYLAFDLFIGCWEVMDAKERGVSHWLVVPCLFLTFMFGPAGLLLYFALRAVASRRLASLHPV